MAKKRKEFIQLVIDESYDNIVNSYQKKSLFELLEMTSYREKQRAKNNPWKVDPKDEVDYWRGVKKRLVDLESVKDTDNDEVKGILKEIISHYGNEIAGNFNPSHYSVVKVLINLGFARLLNVFRVKGFYSLFKNQLDLGDKIHVKGKIDQIRKLAKKGTVVMVPTHSSNLDSALIGWVINYLGLPPFIYGAGLNLFNLKLFAYFMNSVGAYKVDRRKRNLVYLETLKAYSTIAIREGCHSLFFPGGTRARGGKIEKSLKLGLLGTAITAQQQIFEQQESEDKIFIVPVTLNYHFVLEAPSLIDDYLKRKGQERYLVENDEYTTSFKIFKFLVKFFTKGSDISVSIGNALDVVGNRLDDEGNSIDQHGKLLNIKDYFRTNGEITSNKQRENQYNRILASRIVEEYHKINRVFSSHLVAFVAFRMIGKTNKHLDLYNLLRLEKEERTIDYFKFKVQIEKILNILKEMHDAGKVGMADHLSHDTDSIIRHGIKNVGMYHAMPTMSIDKGNNIIVNNMNLLYFYHNRLLGYDLEKYI